MRRLIKFKVFKSKGFILLVLISLVTVLIYLKWYTCLEGYLINFGPSVYELKFSGVRNLSGPTLCSKKATLEGGLHQKVVSFSLFLSATGHNRETVLERYVPGIKRNYELIQQFYPGWIMRLYTNMNIANLSSFIENSKNFYICDVTDLPGLGDVQDLHEMTWRFLPVGDPTVDIFIVRDLDAEIGERERAAVSEWENSTQIFHAMRDSPHHRYFFVLGGLWGAKNYLINPKAQSQLLEQSIQMSREYRQKESCKCNDQHLLRNLFYRPFKSVFLIHDSYSCERWMDAVPFPTQRDKAHSDFVGSQRIFAKPDASVPECPVQCRPSYGKDWKYC